MNVIKQIKRTEESAVRSIATAVISSAKKSGVRVTAAESCTGGLVCGALTAIPGASEIFDGGAVTYSNEMKTKLLGVKDETLKAVGAVSHEVAAEMAHGALKLTGADIAVALTGIAGPDGGCEEKPVGLVYIAIASKVGALCTQPPMIDLCPAEMCYLIRKTEDTPLTAVFRCYLADGIALEDVDSEITDKNAPARTMRSLVRSRAVRFALSLLMLAAKQAEPFPEI